ncbi:hypothetical protein F5887DRAFT_937266 [Amanita rubescens]|nr:hypothetical protein F5887DRAFT_937266 [Amanita rubescens]
MPRDMSYRKPVPKYIPSPPPSPTKAQEESNFEQCSGEEIPPLPTEWREAIERAVTLGNSVASFPNLSPTSSSEQSDVQHHSICASYHIVKRPTYIRRESGSSVARQRQLRHTFRPPTPPLRTDRPKQRRIEQSVEWLDSCSTLPNMSRVERFSSTAIRLQSSRSTGRTLVATSPVKQSPEMMTFAGRRDRLSSCGAPWTSTLKRICGQLTTKLGRMQWLRC